MLITVIFIHEKLDFTMNIRRGVALAIVVSLPIVSFTYLVLTDEVRVDVFSERFFIGLEKTQELGINLQTSMGEKLAKLANSISFSSDKLPLTSAHTGT